MLQAQRARSSYATIDTGTRAEQASPHRLIELLYDELLSCLRQAGIAIANGNLPLKSERLSKALSILHGLESSLDFTRGGAVAAALADAYAQIRHGVIAANAGNDTARLAPVADAVAELADAWRQIRR